MSTEQIHENISGVSTKQIEHISTSDHSTLNTELSYQSVQIDEISHTDLINQETENQKTSGHSDIHVLENVNEIISEDHLSSSSQQQIDSNQQESHPSDSSHLIDSTHPDIRTEIPENLKIDQDNGVVFMSQSHSESLHSMTPELIQDSQNSDSSQKNLSDQNQSPNSDSMGNESERLQKVHDSKHIIMETPEDLKNREIQKDKEILDRLFDRESGNQISDPDRVSDKDEKLRLIHNIINNNPSGGSQQVPHPSTSSETPNSHSNLQNSGLLDDMNLKGTGISFDSNQHPQTPSTPQQNSTGNSQDNSGKKLPKTTAESSGTQNSQSQSKNITPTPSNQTSQNPQKTVDSQNLKNAQIQESNFENAKSETQKNLSPSEIRPEVLAVMKKRTLCTVTNPIPNCSGHYRGNCIECESEYHLINNICKPLLDQNRIMFCKAYNHDQKCVKCDTGFVLVSGNCLKFKAVVNCRNQVYYPNGKCLICKHGFYFDEEEKKCISREQKYFKQKKLEEENSLNLTQDETGTEDIGFDRNCLLVRNNADKNCFMCRPGYYMDKKGNCLFSDGGYSKNAWSLF